MDGWGHSAGRAGDLVGGWEPGLSGNPKLSQDAEGPGGGRQKVEDPGGQAEKASWASHICQIWRLGRGGGCWA